MTMLENQTNSAEAVDIPPPGGFFEPEPQIISSGRLTYPQSVLEAGPDWSGVAGMVGEVTSYSDLLKKPCADDELMKSFLTGFNESLAALQGMVRSVPGRSRGNLVIRSSSPPLAPRQMQQALEDAYSIGESTGSAHDYLVPLTRLTAANILARRRHDGNVYDPALDIRVQTETDIPITYYKDGRLVASKSDGKWFRFPLKKLTLGLPGLEI